jgi:cytochrome c oxidase subunit 2
MAWTQFGLQDAVSPIIEEFHYFHDFTNSILAFIIIFVGFIIISITNNLIINKNLLEGQLIECVWTLVPGVILVQIALPSLTLLYLLDDSPEASMTVKAIGHQWYWEYEYTDYWSFSSSQEVKFDSYMVPEKDLEKGIFRQLEVDNRLILPALIPIRVLISSADVLHAWTVPRLGVKADAIPGRLNQVNFFGLIAGVLYGQCSEICGAQHSSMPIAVELIPASLFASWYEAFSFSRIE